VISEAAELKKEHEVVCLESHSEIYEEEGENLDQTCEICSRLRTIILDLKEAKKQHIENQRKKVVLMEWRASIVSQIKKQKAGGG
jgi:hypothetical protein